MTVTSMLLFVALGLLACLGALIEAARLMFLFFAIRGVAKGDVRRHRESIRTSLFSVTGWIIAGLAIFFFMKANYVEPPQVSERQGGPLFKGFEPIDVKRMQILKYDSESGRFDDFRVEQRGGDVWRIPSHGNYPADAFEQVQSAANSLINLTIIDVIGSEDVDEELFGVIEPDSQNVAAGQEGVGTLVALRDKNNRDLANMIVGKPVKGEPEKRFVRIPGQTPVYVVEYDPSVLKTDFQSWIDKDLLELEALDVSQIIVNDYQVDPDAAIAERKVNLTRNYELQVKAEFNEWELEKLVVYPDQKTPDVRKLGVNERLNALKLDDLRRTLDTLQIVDVERKPAGLGADLTSGTDFLKDAAKEEEVVSLALHGYIPNQVGDQIELLSSNGEIRVKTKDGLEYLLRFGRIRPATGTELSEGQLNRFLIVTTRVNEDGFPIPTPPAAAATGDSGADVAPPSLDQDEKQDDSPMAQDDAEKRRLERDYQRQVDERNERLRLANAKVKQLNARFADWYYVVPEEDYQKLKIPANELIIR